MVQPRWGSRQSDEVAIWQVDLAGNPCGAWVLRCEDPGAARRRPRASARPRTQLDRGRRRAAAGTVSGRSSWPRRLVGREWRFL